MMTRKVQRSWTKPDRSLRPTASKNRPFQSFSSTCPNILAMVTAVEAAKIANTRRPPSARTRANKVRSRTRLKSCVGAALMSASARGGLATTPGTIGITGCAACGSFGIVSAGACGALGATVEATSAFIPPAPTLLRPLDHWLGQHIRAKREAEEHLKAD